MKTGGPLKPEDISDSFEATEKVTHKTEEIVETNESSPDQNTAEPKFDEKSKDITHHALYYATNMIAAGYDELQIRLELEKNGYSHEQIEEILLTAKTHVKPSKHEYHVRRQPKAYHTPLKKEHQKIHKEQSFGMSYNEKFFMVLYTIFTVFLIGWINIETGSPLGTIFASFLPLFGTILLSWAFFSAGQTQLKIMVWMVPLFASLIWYAIATSGSFPELSQTDAGSIAIFNLVLGMVYLIILDIFKQLGDYVITPLYQNIVKMEKALDGNKTKQTNNTKKTSRTESQLERQIKVHKSEKDIETYIQAIEDKSKALNFAIGRVYSNKHGGSAKLREGLRINKDWYNVFADIPSDEIQNHIIELKKAIYSIGDRLNIIHRTEKEVLGNAANKLNGIERNEDGSSKIIDVLIANDKDPVKTYYKSAVEFCNKAAKEIELIEQKETPQESNIIEENSTQ